MISDLLDLSSMASGSVRLNVEAIDPWQLAMQAIRDLAGRAETAQVQVRIHPPLPTLGRMQGDATRFSQIVLNLLSNAIKYNRPGGEALVSLAVDDGRLTLTLRDGGRGMTAAQLDALFQPFNRLVRDGSNIEGTGIGLVITGRLVELMGGALRVRSTVGDGSEFEVELPFERAESAARASLPSPARRPARRRMRCARWSTSTTTRSTGCWSRPCWRCATTCACAWPPPAPSAWRRRWRCGPSSCSPTCAGSA